MPALLQHCRPHLPGATLARAPHQVPLVCHLGQNLHRRRRCLAYSLAG